MFVIIAIHFQMPEIISYSAKKESQREKESKSIYRVHGKGTRVIYARFDGIGNGGGR